MSEQNHETSDVGPSSLNHIIGQESVKAQVTVALDAAFEDQKKFDHSLLVGPPGLGKTALAQVIAAEMATEFHELLGQSIKSVADLNAVLLAANDKAIVFVDEAHELDKSLQTTLYLALDQRRILVSGGRQGASPTGIPLRDFTLLLASTDEFLLLQPLRDRMRLLLRFEFYSAEELTQIVRHRIHSLQWPIEDEVLPAIAKRSRGTPRLALRLLQSARRVCRSGGDSTISAAHLNWACKLERIDSLGLGVVEQKYLGVLAEGAARLNVLASTIGLPSRTVSEVIEPFLIRSGLVTKDDQGRRVMTALGREHVLGCGQRVV